MPELGVGPTRTSDKTRTVAVGPGVDAHLSVVPVATVKSVEEKEGAGSLSMLAGCQTRTGQARARIPVLSREHVFATEFHDLYETVKYLIQQVQSIALHKLH